MAETPEQQVARLRTQIGKLQDAMSSGILTVEGADGTGRVTYRSYVEMRQALGDLQQRLAVLVAVENPGQGVRRSRIVLTGSGGW